MQSAQSIARNLSADLFDLNNVRRDELTNDVCDLRQGGATFYGRDVETSRKICQKLSQQHGIKFSFIDQIFAFPVLSEVLDKATKISDETKREEFFQDLSDLFISILNPLILIVEDYIRLSKTEKATDFVQGLLTEGIDLGDDLRLRFNEEDSIFAIEDSNNKTNFHVSADEEGFKFSINRKDDDRKYIDFGFSFINDRQTWAANMAEFRPSAINLTDEQQNALCVPRSFNFGGDVHTTLLRDQQP